MVRKKRTRPPSVRESSAIKESSHQAFDVQLVMVRSGTQKASGYHVHGSSLLPERAEQQGVGGSSVPHSPLYSQQGGLGSRQHQSTAQVQKLYQQLVFHDPSSSSQAIQPVPWSRLLRFQKRPSIGTFGTGCTVKTNHFVVNVFNKDLYQYDVCISPEVRSCGVNHAVMGEIVALYRQSHFGGRLPAYDGQKRLYTAGPLPFSFMTFQIELQDEQDSLGPLGDELALQRHVTLYEVVIKFAARVELRPLDMYIAGEQTDEPQIALQALGTVLRELPIPRYSPIAQSFYSESDQRLGEGLEIQRGFDQSIRPTQKGLLLNIDVSYTAFMKPLPVIDFVAQLLNRDISYRPFCVSDHLKINKALEGVKVQVTHGDNMGKKYRVFGLTSQATEGFQVDEKYHFNIQYSALPLLKVGNRQRPNYLPMEVCKIVEGQSYSKQLSEKQMTTLLKVACQYPQDREEDILQIMNHNKYDAHPHVKEFGIKIEKELISLQARVLPPPWLKFHDSGMKTKLLPRMGLWNMMRKKMFNGGRVNNWTCINFCWDVQKSTAMRFCHELAITCLVSGMDFSVDPVLPVVTARPDHVEWALKRCHQHVTNILRPKGRELDLLIVILPNNNGSLYGDLKRICETDIGLVSQCCLAKYVFKMSKQYLANVALKINVKVGGRNAVLLDSLTRRLPCVGDMPTIIFGAHVTHPLPGNSSSPSIAAVVASQDWPEVSNYAGLVSAQAPCQELIQNLFEVQYDSKRGTIAGGMIKEHLISFLRATGQKPQRIIFYRDGVSNGQLRQVLWHELAAMKKACSSLEPNYKPSVTYVVAQKRHHTRLFPDNYDYMSTVGCGNIWPGTVVDSDICHPNEFDFYLCSHTGNQGTSRPVHYHVLWDENKFAADAFQCLTNYLCYTNARCTHSVSVVPPIRYAHLMALRARLYVEPQISESRPMASGAMTSCAPSPSGVHSSGAAGSVAFRCLPPIKDNVKRVMFYC